MAEEQEVLSAEEEFDKAFEEAGGESGTPENPDTDTDDGQGDAEHEAGEGDGKGPKGESDKAGDEGASGSEEGGEGEDPFKAEREKYEARIRDLEEKAKPKETPKEEKPPELPKDVQEFFQDYPEMQNAVEKVVEQRINAAVTKAVESVTGQLGGQMAYERELVNGFFDAEAKAYVEGVPDAYRVLNMPEFEAWAKTDPEAAKLLTTAHTAKQAIPVLKRFKESLARQAADRHDRQQAERSQKAREQAAGSVTPVTRKGTGGKGKEPDPDDFDGAWDEPEKS